MSPEDSNETRPGQPFTIEVDGEEYETNQQELTAAEILQLADRDPAEFDLRRIRGGNKETLDDDTTVKINSGLAFIAVPTGPTGVA